MRTFPRFAKPVIAFFSLFLTFTTLLSADDRFAVAVGARDMLVVFGPKGERITELPVPSISTPVTVGSTSFQVSYGRDANNLLTAIIAPNPSQPQDLHFNVLNKTVDTDKQAVVTLTFSSSATRVNVDPGYVGVVQVNSHSVHHRDVAYEPSAPAPDASLAPVAVSTAGVTPRDLPSDPSPETATSSTSVDTSTKVSPSTMDSAPSTLPDANGSTAYNPINPNQPLFWSEPITAPDGTAPRVGITQMKLVEVQGTVSVRLPDGDRRDAVNGMILPSGSTVLTSDSGSAAVFMGGVNSARLMPNTDAKVTQHLNGSVRKTDIDLGQGTVFSRVGRRAGESQDFQVHTPQGVAAARGTEYATTVRNKHTYVFVAKGSVALFIGGKEYKIIFGSASVGKGSMPPADDTVAIFQQVMAELQAFNGKLAGVLADIGAGTATDAEKAYYQLVLKISGPVVGQILAGSTVTVQNPVPVPQDYTYVNPFALTPFQRRAVNQDFQPFGTVPVTPY